MKKSIIFVCLCVIALYGGLAQAQPATCSLNEPGSLLVYPLIDNINATTIVEVTNNNTEPVWVAGYFITENDVDTCDFVAQSFVLHLTPKEVVWWDTSKPYTRANAMGEINQLASVSGKRGYMYLWAIDTNKDQCEVKWDYLKGDALLLRPTSAFQYNAIPHQYIRPAAVDGVCDAVNPRALILDGNTEYCAAPSTILVEGFGAGFVGGLEGRLVLANLSRDFTAFPPLPPVSLGIDIFYWNQNEVQFDSHPDLCLGGVEHYDIRDLGLSSADIGTPKWQSSVSSAGPPLWAVFYQYLGSRVWGSNVFQHPDTGVATAVVLPPIPPTQ